MGVVPDLLKTFGSQLAGTDFFNMRDAQKSFSFRWQRIWVDSACLKMEEKVYLKLWVMLGCSQYTTACL